jgi:GNAT superfamily N-acetyltransferase
VDPVITVRRLRLDDAAALAQAHAVESEATRRARPGWTPLDVRARVAAWQADNGWGRALVGAFRDETLVGLAIAQTADDTPDTSWVSVSVLPEHQGRGLGTRLAGAVEATASDRVTRFVASAYRATTAELDDLSRRFARPLGYEPASAETVVELDLTGAELPELPTHEGYAVSTYLGGVPGHLRAEVGVLKGLVDAEAPNGDLDWQATPVSVEEYGEELALWQEQGRTAVESIACDGEGRVVAWTCLLVEADPARPAQIEGTLVLPEHRGRRLGTAVKLASLRAARHHGTATRVRTSSEDQNVWMRAINDGLGFVPVESEVIWQKSRR